MKEELFENWLRKNAWRRLDDNNYAHKYKTWGGFPVFKKTMDLYDEYLESNPTPTTQSEGEEDQAQARRDIDWVIDYLLRHDYKEGGGMIMKLRNIQQVLSSLSNNTNKGDKK